MKFPPTLSIVAGTKACNARCPFCVSKMTQAGQDMTSCLDTGEFDIWEKFRKACRYAKACGSTTALITGKGEPVLDDNMEEIIEELDGYFPIIELQTNGIALNKWKVEGWKNFGLTTIALSIVHYEDIYNQKILGNEDYNLDRLIKMIHAAGLSVRLSCVMIKDMIDSVDKVRQLSVFAKSRNVEQLTIRELGSPDESNTVNMEINNWIKEHKACTESYRLVADFLKDNATPLLNIGHGATVYDYNGQNICISNCLTLDPDEIRQLIFFPDTGKLMYDWCHTGAVIF